MKDIPIERVLSKWKPVLESARIDEKYQIDLAVYCENLALKSETNNVIMSLKLLSRLDLSKVLLTNSSKGCETYSCTVTMTTDQVLDLKFQLGIDVQTYAESAIIEGILGVINKMIDETGGIVFHKYCGVKNELEQNKIVGSVMCYPFPIQRINKIKKIRSILNKK